MDSALVIRVLVLAGLVACGAAPAAQRARPLENVAPRTTPSAASAPEAAAALPDEQPSNTLDAADARLERGREAIDAWDFDLAVQELEPALAVYEAELPDTDDRVIEAMLLVGRAYRRTLRWNEATAMLARRLAIVEDAGSADEAATTLNELGLTYKETGRHGDAIPYFERCLAIDDALGRAEDDAERMVHVHNLAITLSYVGEAQRSIELLERVLASDRRADPTSVSTANTMHNLAIQYRDNDELERARPLFESAIRIVGARLGADHPHLLPLLNGLGGTLLLMGERAEAELVFNQVLTQTATDPDNEYRVTALAEVATLEAARGATDEALEHIDHALATMRAQHPDARGEIVKVLVKRAEVLLAAGDIAAAGAETEAAITMSAAANGDRTQLTVETIEWLATVWSEAGDRKHAKALRARAAKLAKPAKPKRRARRR